MLVGERWQLGILYAQTLGECSITDKLQANSLAEVDEPPKHSLPVV